MLVSTSPIVFSFTNSCLCLIADDDTNVANDATETRNRKMKALLS